MRAITLFALAFALTLQLQTQSLQADTSFWTGAGDGVTWTNAANWSNDIPPTAVDNAVINGVGTNVVITVDGAITIQSLQCSASLSLPDGSLTLTAGPSQVTGSLSLGINQVLEVDGDGTTFTCLGPVLTDDGNFTVSAGASVSLPGLLNYNKTCYGDNWTVTGAGSVLSLPGLTNLSGSACNFPTIQVTAGGQLQATNLATILEAPLTVLADGTNSVVNFPALVSAAEEGGYFLQFIAQNGGTVWIPRLTNAPLANMSVSSGGVLPTAQFQQLGGLAIADAPANLTNLNTLYGQAVIDDITQNFPALTNFYDASISVSGGAVVTMPALVNYTKNCNGANWTIAGSNSVLSLPALTNLSGAACNYPTIQATAGGQLQATNLATILEGPLTVLADGTSSLVNLPALVSAAGEGGYLLQFVAQNGGTVWIPQLTNAPLVAVTLTSGGVMPTPQLQQLDGITLADAIANFNDLNTLYGQSTISGMTVNFPSLTNFYDASITVSGGAVVTLPALQNYSKNCNGANWTVTGSNSVLSLPALTNFAGAVCSYPTIQATAGGQLLATNLVAILEGPLTVLADGTNSLVDFPALVSAAGEGGYLLQFTAQNAGTVWIPRLTNAPLAAVSLNSGGILPTAQFQQLGGLTLADAPVNVDQLNTLFGQTTIDGVTQNFPDVTNFDDANITVSSGAVVTLPALQNYTKDCAGANWTVTGTGSLLSLPALTNLSGAACGYATIQATGGGELVASNLFTVSVGALTLLADGTDSLIELSQLRSGAGGSDYPLAFVAQNGGVVQTPNLASFDLVSLTAQSAGLVNLNQVQGISGGNCTITANGDGSVVDLSSLSAFATPAGASSLTATNDGRILLGNDVFLLQNVAVSWPGGPGLPSTVSAADSLSLYGQVGLSYEVDVLDSRNPAGTWQFYARVPLTNVVQAVAGTQQPWEEFRVYPFVANPPILDINLFNRQSGQVVLYSMTNLTFLVQTSTNLAADAPWQPLGPPFTSTNSFHIFPLPALTPQQFFRWQQP